MNRPLLEFLDRTPSSMHAAEAARRTLTDAGWRTRRRDGAVLGWYIPSGAGPGSRFRILAAHTDSPGLKLKPHPGTSSAGFAELAAEVYGGPILHTWFDRELTVAGQLILDDGQEVLVDTGPVARIPSLATHLGDPGQIDRQRHLRPVLATTDTTSIMDVLARQTGIPADAIAGFDLIAVDAQPAAIFGPRRDLLASRRLDNLSSVWAGLRGAEEATAGGIAHADVLVFVAFDHEEVGSSSPTGAAGPFLERGLREIAASLGGGETMLYRSVLVSADAAHSVHPNYPERHDPGHLPLLGGGPVLKVNAKKRYATTARGTALWKGVCAAAGIEGQVFVSNNQMPCGTTIGPISATRLGVETLDVGVPLLSMHSARELAGARDIEALGRAIAAFFSVPTLPGVA